MHADAEVDTNGNKTNAIIMSSAAYAQIEIRAMIDTPYIFLGTGTRTSTDSFNKMMHYQVTQKLIIPYIMHTV